jgi:hypothetical protein
VAYDFDFVHDYALAPTVTVDLMNDEEVCVYGEVLSRHF